MSTKVAGEIYNSGTYWAFASNGYVENPVVFTLSGNHQFAVTGYSSYAGGAWGIVELRIDGTAVASAPIASASATVLALNANVTAGSHRVALAFTNDYYDTTVSPAQDRNLFLDKVAITVAPAPQPSSSPAPQPSASPAPQPSTSPVPPPASSYGPQAGVAAPAGAIILSPGADLQAAANGAVAGAVFFLKAGVYRMQRVVPKMNQVFIGEYGAVLNGSRLLTTFTRETINGISYYVATGQSQTSQIYPDSGACEINHPADGQPHPRCNYNEELFKDDKRMLHVASLAAVGPGKWFFDYPNQKIYFVDDPTGHKIETSVTRGAFTANNYSGTMVPGVQVRNLIIEKYANLAQTGAISEQYPGPGWVIQNNEARLNHGAGIMTTDKSVVSANYVHHNGQLGIGGFSGAFTVENNEIAFNNDAGFVFGWEAGGTKFSTTNGFIGRGNYVHDNAGPGLWTDTDNINTLWENNRVEDNLSDGIVHEISYKAIIRNNVVKRNGLKDWRASSWLWGAGISVDASPDVEVYGNTLDGNVHGIVGIQQNRDCSGCAGAFSPLGPHLISNLYVHNNSITQSAPSQANGIAQDTGDGTIFTSRNNRWQSNTYSLAPNGDRSFAWQNGYRTSLEWKAYGMDTTGTFIQR